MSMDKKQPSAGDSSGSNSSLPLFSPVVDKDTTKSLDFSAAALAFPSSPILENEALEPSFSSLHLIANQSCSLRQPHEEGGHLLLSKEEKMDNLAVSLESMPILEKEKSALGEEVFEVPELTAESMISSEQIDLDSQCNPNQLPLCSTRRHNIDRVFQQQSEGSDQYEDPSKVYLAKQNYAESKGSDRSQSDDFPSICKLCYTIIDKSKRLEKENAELIKETQAVKEELGRVQERNRKLMQQREEQMHAETLPPPLLKEYFLTQIQDINKTLPKVNEYLALYAFDFRGKESESIQRFSQEFKKLEEQVLGRVEKETKRRELDHLHLGYKKIISKLIKDFEERQAKKDMDFRKFVTALTRRPTAEPPRVIQAKPERSRRKSKTYAQEISDIQVSESTKQWQQNKQRIQLQMALMREKESWQQIEKSLIERNNRLHTHVIELTNERNTYRSLAAKYSQEFADFMLRLSKQQSSSLTQSQFFRTLSQRVFQISNCIPFEDNDEQNLFAPQSQEELFEMLDRVRRFYQKIQDYNLQRDNEFASEKSSFMRFLKELVEQNKVTPRTLLETLDANGYGALGYLKELIRSSRPAEKQQGILERQSLGNRILKIEKARSFTITPHGIQDH